MIAMIDDSKLGDRAICFESIGFNVAAGQASSPRASSFTSFAVPRTKGVLAPGFPQLPESCRSSPIRPSCQSHSHSPSMLILANRITAHVTWTVGQSSGVQLRYPYGVLLWGTRTL